MMANLQDKLLILFFLIIVALVSYMHVALNGFHGVNLKSYASVSKTIVVAVNGGLGNRIRTLADLYSLQHCSNAIPNAKFEMYWKPFFNLNATYPDLFRYPVYKKSNLLEIVNEGDYKLLTQPTSGKEMVGFVKDMLDIDVSNNLYLVKSLQKTTTAKFMQLQGKEKHFIIMSAWGLPRLSVSKHCYKDKTKEFISKLQPSHEVEKLITPTLELFSAARKRGKRVVAIHVRLTDFLLNGFEKTTVTTNDSFAYLSSKLSPVKDSLFIASDQEADEQLLGDKFRNLGFEVISFVPEGKYSSDGADRSSTRGMQIALGDIFLLANSDEFWANSKRSSYAKLAADIGGIQRLVIPG